MEISLNVRNKNASIGPKILAAYFVERSTYDTMYHMKRSQKRKSAKISEAVFRGKRSLYGFEVFPLTAADIQDGPAVLLI